MHIPQYFTYVDSFSSYDNPHFFLFLRIDPRTTYTTTEKKIFQKFNLILKVNFFLYGFS
jgi:hypothetical protein